MSNRGSKLLVPRPEGIVTLSEKEAGKLGMETNITRRDFVGTTLLGAGTALLASAAPGAIRQVRAQTPGLPMTGLGPDWTGPGGVGDYANANGNTHEVVNAAHGHVRNQDMDQYLGKAQDTGETVDLLIVGCGLSGLAAGYTYHKNRPNATVLILDQHPVFGGEARQNEFEVDGTRLWAPQGSTGIPGPLDYTKQFFLFHELYNEIDMPMEYAFQPVNNTETKGLGVPTEMFWPMHIAWSQADIGYFFESKGWVKNMWADGLKNAPYSVEDKQAFLAAESYRAHERRPDWQAWLDSMTYSEFLRNVMKVNSAEFEKYIAPVIAAMGCGLGPDVVSAFYAYNFGAPGLVPMFANTLPASFRLIGRPQENIQPITLPGGNAGLARRIVQKLLPGTFKDNSLKECLLGNMNFAELDQKNSPVRVRLSSTVIAVQHDGDPENAKKVVVYYERGGQLYKVKGKGVVVAGQQHVNRHICRDIPQNYRDSMNAFHHAPILSINVAMRNWRFLDRLGIANARWFDGFGWWTGVHRGILVDGKATMPMDPNKPVVMTQYNPFLIPGLPHVEQCTAARMQLFGMSYAEIEASVRMQFTKMFASAGFDAKRDIAGITTNRFGHAYVAAQPGLYFNKDGTPGPRQTMRQNFQRIAFAHAELHGGQAWYGAFEEGTRAAEQILNLA